MYSNIRTGLASRQRQGHYSLCTILEMENIFPPEKKKICMKDFAANKEATEKKSRSVCESLYFSADIQRMSPLTCLLLLLTIFTTCN